MIYVSCQFEAPIGRSDYSDYVRALQLDISGCDAVGNRSNGYESLSENGQEIYHQLRQRYGFPLLQLFG